MATYYDLKPSYKDSNGDIHTIPTYAVDTVLNTESNNAISNSAVATALQGLQTATGNPVTITNAAPINAQEVKVDINAVQDLNGYDKPWAGGAGKNKLPLELTTIQSLNTGGTWSGNAYTLYGITFTIQTDNGGNVTGIKANGTSNRDTFLDIAPETSFNGSYILNGCPSGGSASTYELAIYNAGLNAFIARDFGDGSGAVSINEATRTRLVIRNGQNISNLVFLPMIRLSTETDSTFSPYSNICPITGWDSIDVYRCGKNLLPSMPYPYEAKTLIDYGQDITLNGYTLSFVFSGSFLHETAAFLIFRMSDGSLSTSATAIKFYRKVSDNTYITANTTYTNEPIYFSSTGSITFRKIVIYNYPIFTDAKFKNAQLEEGSTATTYEPYNGTTYTKSLSTTNYGGYWDATEGVIGTEYGYIDLGTLNWTTTTTGATRPESSASLGAKFLGDLMCTAYKGVQVSHYDSLNNGEISITNSATAPILRLKNENFIGLTAEQIKAELSGVMLKYELATPTTESVTSEEIPLSQGTNNLWSDTGDVEVKYWTNNVIGQLVGLIQQSQS